MSNPYEPPIGDVAVEERPSIAASPGTVLVNFALLFGVVIQTAILFSCEWDVGITLVAAGALTMGMIAHVVYAKLLRLRFTVPLTVLLLINAEIQGLVIRASEKLDLQLLVQAPLIIPSSIRFDTGLSALVFMLTACTIVLLMACAHSIRPGFRTALVTSLGIGIWYTTSLLILSNAG